MDPVLVAKGWPGTSKIKQILYTVCDFCDFTIFSSTRFWASFWSPFWKPFGPKMAETSLGIPLGAAKSRSRLVFFGLRAVQERSKMSPRPLQEASRRPIRSKKTPRCLWGPTFTPPRPLGTSKTAVWGMNSQCFEGPPGACQEHATRHPRAFRDILRQACCVKSFPRYS